MCFKWQVLLIVAGLNVIGCAAHRTETRSVGESCIEQLTTQMEMMPAQTHLRTLDSQMVPLDEFFRACLAKAPACALPLKFYHWKNETKVVTSDTPNGRKAHKIRIYYNYMSTCNPDMVDHGKTHGDIAEFYNERGEFMGLAVYAGHGLYCPLPYSNYNGRKDQIKGFI